MTILDLFKEIPLSAVLKERLVDLEKKLVLWEFAWKSVSKIDVK